MSELFYGSKYENGEIIVRQGTKEELEKEGLKVYNTEWMAKKKAEIRKHFAYRKILLGMTMEELKSPQALEMAKFNIKVRKLSVSPEDYIQGIIDFIEKEKDPQ